MDGRTSFLSFSLNAVICIANDLIVGAANKALIGSFTWKMFATLDKSLLTSKEWPPISKKLSSIVISSTFNMLHHISANFFSILVRGLIHAFVFGKL